MTMIKARISTVLLATAFALISPLVGAQHTIKLGMTSALTGPFNEFGEGNRRGVVLAIDEWNKKGGINGKKIELAEALDDQLVPDKAVQNMRRILDNKEIVAIIAPAGSGPALATIDMLEVDGRPTCNPLAQSPSVIYPKGKDQPPRKNIVSVAITNESEGNRIGQLLSKQYKTIGVIHDSTAYGVTGSELVKKSILANNPTAKVQLESYNQRSQDMTSQVARLQRINAEAILVIGQGADAAVIRKNVSRLNVKAAFFGSTGAVTVPYFEGAADLALGTRSVSPSTLGKRPLSAYAQNFVDQYRAAYGTDRFYGSDAANPQVSMATVVGTAYDCTVVLLDAIRRAGSTESAAVIAALNQTTDLPGASIPFITITAQKHEAFKPEDLALFEVSKSAAGALYLKPVDD
jgi:branched-chain amino acid transport system substrate-binding protein